MGIMYYILSPFSWVLNLFYSLTQNYGPHRGFACFRGLMEKYRPKMFVHGHVHANYGGAFKRKDRFGETLVVNGFEYYMVEYPE